MIHLASKTALVTGASRGIGCGIAAKLINTGVERIAITYVSNDSAANDAANVLRGKGAEILLVKADYTKQDQVITMFDQVRTAFDSLDIFVHITLPNPSTAPSLTSAMELTCESLDAAYQSQVQTLTLGCQQCVSMMHNGGRIIGITHNPGVKTGGGHPWAEVDPAKAALEATLRYFAVSLASEGITVNIISPGVIDDSFISSLPENAYQALKDRTQVGRNPMKRLGTPADIGNAVTLLCTPEASFITGQTLYVDGGQSLMFPEVSMSIQAPYAY